MTAVDRERHGQLVVDPELGDCFRACISVILDVPNGDHLPNDHLFGWWFTWQHLLWDFGLSLHHASSDGPIWKGYPWIASVPSKNFEGKTHAIVMEDHKILFDPSSKRRYRAGTSLLGKDVVLGGYWFELANVHAVANLVEFRRAHA